MNVNLSVFFGVGQASGLAADTAGLPLQNTGKPLETPMHGFIGELLGAAGKADSPLMASVDPAGLPPSLIAQLRQHAFVADGNALPLDGDSLPLEGMATDPSLAIVDSQERAKTTPLVLPVDRFLTVVDALPVSSAQQLLAAVQLVASPEPGTGTAQPLPAVLPQVELPAATPAAEGDTARLLDDGLALRPDQPAAANTVANPLADGEVAVPLTPPVGKAVAASGDDAPGDTTTAIEDASPPVIPLAPPGLNRGGAPETLRSSGEVAQNRLATGLVTGSGQAGPVAMPAAQRVDPPGLAQGAAIQAPVDPLQLQSGSPLDTQPRMDLRGQSISELAPLTEAGKLSATGRGEALADGAVRPALAGGALQEVSASRVASQAVFQLPVELPTANKQWGEQLAGRLRWLAAHQVRVADLQLNPAELGPLRVRVEHSGEAASVTFTVQQAATRELLEANLPRLRDLFSAQGMELLDVDVSGESLTGRGEQQLEGESGDGRALAHGDQPTADTTEPQLAPVQTVQLHYGLINTFA